MSREIKATPTIMSTTSIDENEWIGSAEGEFFIGFDLPIEELQNFRLDREVIITISEAAK